MHTKLFVNKVTGHTNDACSHVVTGVDDALSPRMQAEATDDARYIGWHYPDQDSQVLFIAVWSYLGVRVEDTEAVELATDIASERGHSFCIRPPDYVL